MKKVIAEKTTRRILNRILAALRHSRLALEAGTHSPWVSRHLKELGHAVIGANPRRVRLITASSNQNDRLDAEMLARLARVDPKMLYAIRHRGETAQADLTVIRTRASLVEARTRLINPARGLSKSFGERLRKCDARYVNEEMAQDLPAPLKEAMEPLRKQIGQLSGCIREFDEAIQKMARERYPEVELLTAICGDSVKSWRRAEAKAPRRRRAWQWLGNGPFSCTICGSRARFTNHCAKPSRRESQQRLDPFGRWVRTEDQWVDGISRLGWIENDIW
jgi:transposase